MTTALRLAELRETSVSSIIAFLGSSAHPPVTIVAAHIDCAEVRAQRAFSRNNPTRSNPAGGSRTDVRSRCCVT